MSSPNDNWYSHLVAQSKTDAIYTLIHQFLTPEWEPGHDLDFVVVQLSDLPENLQPVPLKHIAKKLKPEEYCFPATDFILLHNYELTDYLHAAKWAKTIEDFEDRSFIQLCFCWTDEAEFFLSHPPAYSLGHRSETMQQQQTSIPEESLPVTSEDFPLFVAYELLHSGTSPQQALGFAEQGKAFLDAQHIVVDTSADTVPEQLLRRMMGYNVVAMVYVWNNQINKAAEVDEQYIHYPVIWSSLAGCIRPYLEMLMVQKQQDYLEYLFRDKGFRSYFLAHHEAFVSLFMDDTFELTLMSEVVSIINRVNNTRLNEHRGWKRDDRTNG